MWWTRFYRDVCNVSKQVSFELKAQYSISFCNMKFMLNAKYILNMTKLRGITFPLVSMTIYLEDEYTPKKYHQIHKEIKREDGKKFSRHANQILIMISEAK